MSWKASLEHPWIGHGFHSFRNVVPDFGLFEPWHAHNELLQLFYSYGVVGLLLFIAGLRQFLPADPPLRLGSDKALFYGLLLFILIRGFGDTDRFELTLPFGLFFYSAP